MQNVQWPDGNQMLTVFSVKCNPYNIVKYWANSRNFNMLSLLLDKARYWLWKATDVCEKSTKFDMWQGSKNCFFIMDGPLRRSFWKSIEILSFEMLWRYLEAKGLKIINEEAKECIVYSAYLSKWRCDKCSFDNWEDLSFRHEWKISSECAKTSDIDIISKRSFLQRATCDCGRGRARVFLSIWGNTQ